MMKMKEDTNKMVSIAKDAAKRAGQKFTEGFESAFVSVAKERRKTIGDQAKFKMSGIDTLQPKQLSIYNQELTKLTKQYGNLLPKLTLQNEALKRTKELTKPEGFKGWAMSIMFAGMAMKNAMIQLWSSSVKTFNEVRHSVEGAVTGFDMLEGSMAYLWFSLGQALEPIAFMLVPIIDKVSEWVSENEKLVAGITKWGVILGGLMAAGGGLTLALAGVNELYDKLLLIPDQIKALGDKKNWEKIGERAKQYAGTIFFAWGLSETAEGIEKIKNGDFLKGSLEALGGVLTTVGGALWMMGKAGGPLIIIGTAMALTGKGTLIQSIISIIGIITSLFAAAFKYIGNHLYNTLGEKFMAWVKKVIEYLKWIPGMQMTYLALKGITGFGSEAESTQSFIDMFKEIYREQMIVAKQWDDTISKFLQVDMFRVLDASGKDLNDTMVRDLLDARNYKDESSLLPAIGNVTINVTQNPGETNLNFADRIAQAIRYEIEKQKL
jgi:hypothetical protein